MHYTTTDMLTSSSLWLKHHQSISSAIEVGSRSIDVIEASKSVVLCDWVPMIVTTFTDVEALSLQAWTSMLLSILSYWGCGQVVHNIIYLCQLSHSKTLLSLLGIFRTINCFIDVNMHMHIILNAVGVCMTFTLNRLIHQPLVCFRSCDHRHSIRWKDAWRYNHCKLTITTYYVWRRCSKLKALFTCKAITMLFTKCILNCSY